MSAFRCTDGTCIPLSWRCDSKDDCHDGSDEAGCSNAKVCHNGQYECRITQLCIPHDWLCDNDYDCGQNDTSDEDLPTCYTTKKCLPNQTECTGGICIDTDKFCDGKFDCINDEYVEFCSMYYYIFSIIRITIQNDNCFNDFLFHFLISCKLLMLCEFYII